MIYILYIYTLEIINLSVYIPHPMHNPVRNSIRFLSASL